MRPCPICNSTKIELLHTQHFTDNFSHEISSCVDCGFVFVSNTPDAKYYKEYYKKASKYEGTRIHEPHETITKKTILSFFGKNIKKSAKILDVGCSTGTTLSYIREAGFNNINGFDPAPLCKKIALEKYNIKIDTDDLLSYKSKKKFDFIIISQVLEHIVDLNRNFRKLNSLLSDDGYIFIGVPNMENSSLKYGEPFMEFSTEHINFFSFSYLSQFMKNYSCVFKKIDSLVILTVWKKNIDLKKLIEKYIKVSSYKIKSINKKINNIKGKIIVWGAGSLAQKLLKTSELKSKVLKFVDSNPNIIGNKLLGIEVISPELLQNNKFPILVLSYRYQKEIINYIKKAKLTKKIITI